MSVTIWHNPNCTSSRTTLALLLDRGLSPEVRLYLTDPPRADEIIQLAGKLNLPVAGFIRKNEAIFASLGLDPAGEDQALAAAISGNPILLQRPIVVSGDRAAIGRPPETVLDIL